MKKISSISIILISLFINSCSFDLPVLTIADYKWITTTEKINDLTFGYVKLSLRGVTNGDRVTVLTYGDGVISEYQLFLDQENMFNEEIVIKYTHQADDIPRMYSTVITAYKGRSSNKIKLTSGELKYL